ncbi:hypothetical protein DASC09_019770 [Saccharomycopsis crataegensis]|uniref:Hap4 transcription factor heteromerisation domain-containing protein n=1 Tax=Saccharomycopsis crataegensis TaxID=43959 RepID=A0AAV5QJ58_9ASCO|nr:hypothetical protein DASC09_019770 [Saccharomycopsis crataegensis]
MSDSHLISRLQNSSRQNASTPITSVKKSSKPKSAFCIKTSKNWVLPPRPKPGRKPSTNATNNPDSKKRKNKNSCKSKSILKNGVANSHNNNVNMSSGIPNSVAARPMSMSTSSQTSNDSYAKHVQFANQPVVPEDGLLEIEIIRANQENSVLKEELSKLVYDLKSLRQQLNDCSASPEEKGTKNVSSPSTDIQSPVSSLEMTQNSSLMSFESAPGYTDGHSPASSNYIDDHDYSLHRKRTHEIFEVDDHEDDDHSIKLLKHDNFDLFGGESAAESIVHSHNYNRSRTPSLFNPPNSLPDTSNPTHSNFFDDFLINPQQPEEEDDDLMIFEKPTAQFELATNNNNSSLTLSKHSTLNSDFEEINKIDTTTTVDPEEMERFFNKVIDLPESLEEENQLQNADALDIDEFMDFTFLKDIEST